MEPEPRDGPCTKWRSHRKCSRFTVGGVASNGVLFTVTVVPTLTSVTPTASNPGGSITIMGNSFGNSQGTSAQSGWSEYGCLGDAVDQLNQIVAQTAASASSRVRRRSTKRAVVQFRAVHRHERHDNERDAFVRSSGDSGSDNRPRSNFGSSQGRRSGLAGSTANAIVQSWSGTQIVATVASSSMTGNTQVLQNGVWSNKIPFTVNIPTITNVNPISGVVGTSVTLTGSGFGNSQGTGSVQLGSINGNVVSWSDTQVIATVATGSVTGIARVQQGGYSSNAVAFTVPPGGGGNSLTLVPYLLNMVVGDARTVQALNSAGQPVTGLTWTSSNPAVANLSTDDPAVISALAAGHATITAGSASCDITVSATNLPNGTVQWSNPGDGSGVQRNCSSRAEPKRRCRCLRLPERWHDSGDRERRVHHVDGGKSNRRETRLPAQCNARLPGRSDPLAGVRAERTRHLQTGRAHRTGISGLRAVGAFDCGFAPGNRDGSRWAAVSTDGTVFALVITPGPITSLVGINPITGSQTLSVPIPTLGGGAEAGPIVAGDGYAYIAYSFQDSPSGGTTKHVHLLRANSAGLRDDIPVTDVLTPAGNFELITNADQGVLLTWTTQPAFNIGMATTVGTNVTLAVGPAPPGPNYYFRPSLQAQDGSFVAFQQDGSAGNIVAFNADGSLRWSAPGDYPAVATDDGSVIGRVWDSLRPEQEIPAVRPVAHDPVLDARCLSIGVGGPDH